MQIRIHGMLALAVVGCLLACGCGRKPANSVALAGSTAFQPFAEKLAEHYMAKTPGANITVQGGGSALGIQSAVQGTAQIGMADLVTLPPEAKALTATVVARDGIAVVVNPANKVTNLTTEQVRDLFNGKITNWKDVGGEDGPVRVVSREAGSGTRTSFEQILGGISLIKDAIIQDSNGTIRETVANDKNTLGYLSHGLLNDRIKAVNVDGKGCTEKEILAGEYKLVRPVFLLTQGAPAGAAKEFIDYVLTPEGQEIIKDKGLGLLPAK